MLSAVNPAPKNGALPPENELENTKKVIL